MFPEYLRLLLVVDVPANPACVGRVVVLALDDVLRAAVVEAEDFVVQVEAVGVDLEACRQAVAGLSVELEVGVEVVVSGGARRATDLRIRHGLLNTVKDDGLPLSSVAYARFSYW